MTRALTSPTTAAVGADVTQPGYLVQIDFASPLRLSGRGAITWAGQSWAAWDVRIDGIGIDGAASAQNGSVTLGNADYTTGALVLGEGVSGRAVNIWKFYGEAPALGDPVLVFSGVGDDAIISPDGGVVRIGLQQSGGVTLFCPRTYITRESGRAFLPATGSIIQWNGETFRLEAPQ